MQVRSLLIHHKSHRKIIRFEQAKKVCAKDLSCAKEVYYTVLRLDIVFIPALLVFPHVMAYLHFQGTQTRGVETVRTTMFFLPVSFAKR